MKRMIDMGKFKLKRGMGEGGLTLVEILAALVILTIVFTAFFSFFTQSAIFTKHNKEKLTAVQVAEEVVADVRDGEFETGPYDKDGYEVSIMIKSELVGLGLKKAVITVKSPSDVGIKGSSFITEMYFSEDEDEVVP